MQVLPLISHLVVGEHDPEASLNEVGHFILEEVTEEVGRRVGLTFGTVLDGLGTLQWIVHVHLHTMITEFLQVVMH